MKTVAALTLLLLAGCSGSEPKRDVSGTGGDAPAVGWSIVIPPAGEPGEPMVVSGKVVDAERRNAIEGATVYAYHTDAGGRYSIDGRNESQPRLHGTMSTNAKGEYRFSSIRPGSYPGTMNPGHIHFSVTASGYRTREFEIMFDGDPLVGDELRSEAARPESPLVLRPLVEGAGDTLTCSYDVELRPSGG